MSSKPNSHGPFFCLVDQYGPVTVTKDVEVDGKIQTVEIYKRFSYDDAHKNGFLVSLKKKTCALKQSHLYNIFPNSYFDRNIFVCN